MAGPGSHGPSGLCAALRTTRGPGPCCRGPDGTRGNSLSVHRPAPFPGALESAGPEGLGHDDSLWIWRPVRLERGTGGDDRLLASIRALGSPGTHRDVLREAVLIRRPGPPV